MATRDDGSHYTPWFDGWPPEARGDSMTMEEGSEHKWAQWIPYGAFILVAVVGWGLIERFPDGLGHEIGFAAIIAGIVGIVIEITFVKQLAKHVFEIAFGYLLRKEIANEIRWIYKLNKLVTKYTHEFTFQKVDSEHVWVYETIIRTVKNIGDKSEDIVPSLGIQEWFQKNGRSEIISYKITDKEGKTLYDNSNLQLERPNKGNQGCYILSVKETPVGKRFGRGEEYTWAATSRELRHISDDTVFWGMAPAMNPEIRVNIPDDMGYDLTFGNRKQPDVYEPIKDHWRLDTMILPGQAFRLRWWPKAESDKWKKEIDEKYGKAKSNQKAI